MKKSVTSGDFSSNESCYYLIAEYRSENTVFMQSMNCELFEN